MCVHYCAQTCVHRHNLGINLISITVMSFKIFATCTNLYSWTQQVVAHILQGHTIMHKDAQDAQWHTRVRKKAQGCTKTHINWYKFINHCVLLVKFTHLNSILNIGSPKVTSQSCTKPCWSILLLCKKNFQNKFWHFLNVRFLEFFPLFL